MYGPPLTIDLDRLWYPVPLGWEASKPVLLLCLYFRFSFSAGAKRPFSPSMAGGRFLFFAVNLKGSGLLHLAKPLGVLLLQPGARHPAVQHRRKRPG